MGTDGIDGYFESMSAIFDKMDRGPIRMAIGLIGSTKDSDSVVYIMGNGGSASTAMHLTCDFNKGCGNRMSVRFRFVCLCDNVPMLTAYANDCGYDKVFVNQLKGRIKKGDVILCLSGSGNSPNVVNAARYARERGCKVISFTGFDGGELMKVSDCPIHVPIDDMQKAEDCHLIIGHFIAQTLME